MSKNCAIQQEWGKCLVEKYHMSMALKRWRTA